MTSASPNPEQGTPPGRRAAATAVAAVALAAMLAALVPLPAQGQGDGVGWRTIDSETRCTGGTMRLEENLRILAGGALVLEGCTLQVLSAPYQDRWIGAESEGLDIWVEAGGRLELRSTPQRAAAIEPVDARYGYTVTVYGSFVAEGQPGVPAVIRGLEGYMAESFLGGGLLVVGPGTATITDTRITDIKGPAVYAAEGGQATLRGVTVREASGAFAALNATLRIEDTDTNTGIEAIRVARSELVLRNVTAGTDRIALHATHSKVTATDVELRARNVVVLLESDVTLTGCLLRYHEFGVTHQPSKARGLPGRLQVEDCLMQPLAKEGGVAVYGEHADVRVAGSRLEGYRSAGVSIRDASVEVVGTSFNGTADTDIYATDAQRTRFDGNTHSAAATRPVRVMYQVQATVLGPLGEPAPGAQLRLGDATGVTDATGAVTLLWEPPTPEAAAAEVEAVWQNRTLGLTVTPADRSPVFDFGAPDERASGPAGGLAALALAAVAALRARRRA